jgi:hypothetical protein
MQQYEKLWYLLAFRARESRVEDVIGVSNIHYARRPWLPLSLLKYD